MQTQRHLLRLPSASFLVPSLPPPPFPHHLYFGGRPTNQYSSVCSAHREWVALAQLSEELTTRAGEQGPIELPPSVSWLLTSSSSSDILQTAASFLITGAFTLFLFQTFRNSAQRAKQRRLRSRSVKEEAMEGLRKVRANGIKKKKKKSPPSVDQTLVGALIAAAFGIMLYKFTTTVEFTLNNQPLSPNYSVRQITITIRTIINGLCYLATFVFGFNSLGLFLYSGQLAMNSFVPSEAEPPLSSSSSFPQLDTSNTSAEDQSSDSSTQK